MLSAAYHCSSRFADGQMVNSRYMFCFSLIRAEGLDISPLYVQPFYNGLRGLVRLWTELLGKVDLIIGLPEIAEKKLMFLRCALGAQYLVGESRRSYRAP